MRSGPLRYPVDRYLDKGSKQFEMVNIIGDDIWNSEPALRPEDEIILRKLHDMLQSTADDLKLLSGELAKFHQPGVVIKTAPTPLDEEFNEKVHIEEMVNAKFHGYKIIDRPNVVLENPRKDSVSENKTKNNNQFKVNNSFEAKTTSKVGKKPVVNRNLGVSRIRIMEINNKERDDMSSEKMNNGKVLNTSPAVGYNQYYEYVEPKVKESSQKVLQVQNMPSINIRSELKQQNVLQLDIIPDSKENIDQNVIKSNISVITLRHETVPKQTPVQQKIQPESIKKTQLNESSNTVRKISKLSTCESSASTNNMSSDSKVKFMTQKRIITSIKNSPKHSSRNRNKKNTNKTTLEKHPRPNLDEWKRKLNIVYGASSNKVTKSVKNKPSPKKPSVLNNREYIPYSKLTVGGVRASDIEKEISKLPNKDKLPLSPILDKILNSRENSFHSPRKLKDSPRILTTSDENLLQEVIDIERSVTDTLSKNLKQVPQEPMSESNVFSINSNEGNESYADDFENEKSDRSERSPNKASENLSNDISRKSTSSESLNDFPEAQYGPSTSKTNATYAKTLNLSFKESVDIFEFVHLVDTQDNATQSNASNKISLKETQTSPTNDKLNTQPVNIHNDLWPSIDPRREVEKMFELEKDFIKKLIIDEYGDLLEKNINKPSTSNENTGDSRKNITALQKNTQTSPAHVKSVMTSPTRTKTRTTSPFNLTVPVDKPTSPMIVVTDEEPKIDIRNEADDISVNLSSPRFSLRLPQNSREVLSNMTANSRSHSKISIKDKLNRTFRKSTTSTSSVDVDNSSSELSSLGEIKIRRRLRKKVPSISESSTTSSVSKYGIDWQSVGILPLRSEGEVSLGQVSKKKTVKSHPSDGETSFGPK